MATNGINYKTIVENLDIKNIKAMLEHLGADVIDKGDYLISNTICHNRNPDEGSYKLYYYNNTHLFHCYTEDGSMSIFDFLRHVYETRGVGYNWYNDILEVARKCGNINNSFSFENESKYSSIRYKYTPEHPNIITTYSNGILDIFDKIKPVEWLEEGISSEALEKFNIRYSISQNKIIIPHYNLESQLIGIRGRALDNWEITNVGKYMPVQIEGKFYSHPLSLNLYGFNVTKENIKTNRICYVFESEKSVLKMESFNMPNCAVAVCGSNLNKHTFHLLNYYGRPNEVIVCFDNEEKPYEDKYFNKLYNMCKKYTKYTNFSFVYDKGNYLQPKDAPIDKGEEIFRQLVKERVKVK